MEKRYFIKKIANLEINLFEKLFCALRYYSSPFEMVEKYILKKGKILDVGCGHGLLEIILKEKSNQRNILAIDPDSNKIKQAKKIEKLFKNLEFEVSFIEELDEKNKFDCIIFFDIDYLLEHSEKKKILEKAKNILEKNGTIILKTVVNDGSFGYYLGYLQELVMVFLIKKTFTMQQGLSFLKIEEYRNLFKKIGLEIKKEEKIKTIFYHPHYVFIIENKK